MPVRRPIRLPKQWPNHIKSGILHAISLASVVLTHARGRATGRRRLQAKLEQANTEIALLREELSIKDGRWHRSRSRRRPHYTAVQRMRLLQLRAARGWGLEKTARVFLVDLHTLQIWMRRLDEHGERALIRPSEPVNRYPDFVRNLVRQLKRLFPAMGYERMALVLARVGLVLGATTIRRMVREKSGPPEDDAEATARRRRRVVAKYPGHTWHVDLTTVPTRAGFLGPMVPVLAAATLALLLVGWRGRSVRFPAPSSAFRCTPSSRHRTRSKLCLIKPGVRAERHRGTWSPTKASSSGAGASSAGANVGKSDPGTDVSANPRVSPSSSASSGR